MVRGVNKTVIEINNTDSGYIERAILFINPEHSHLSNKRLKAEAKRYVDNLFENEEGTKRLEPDSSVVRAKRKKTLLFLCGLLVIAAAALITILNIL